MNRCPRCRYNLDHAERDEKPRVGDLSISLYGDCQWKGQRVALTGGEIRLVYALALEAGKFIPTPVLRSEHSKSSDNGTLRVIVAHIRRKFEAVDPSFDRIQGHQGRGYRWLVDGMDPTAA